MAQTFPKGSISRDNENHSFPTRELISWGTLWNTFLFCTLGWFQTGNSKELCGLLFRAFPHGTVWNPNQESGVTLSAHTGKSESLKCLCLYWVAGVTLDSEASSWKAWQGLGPSPADGAPLMWPWLPNLLLGWNSPCYPHFTWLQSFPGSLALPPIHSHVAVCHPFFPRSIAQKEPFEYQFL